MRFKKLGKSGIDVSVIAVGTWAIGGDFWGPSDEKESIETIRAAVANGITLIDTAPGYGQGLSETIVGKAVKGLRDKVVLASKCGCPLPEEGKPARRRDATYAGVIKQVEDSLRRMDVDCIDVMQIHWPDPDTSVEEHMNAFAKLKQDGKIRAIGVSNYNIELMSQCLQYGQLDSLQPQFSMIYRKEEENMKYCYANQVGVLTYGSLGSGVLSGKYTELPTFPEGDNRARFYPFFKEPYWSRCMQLVDVLREISAEREKPVAQVAINWAVQQDMVTSSLVGMRNIAQAEENAATADWELSADELKKIDTAYDTIFNQAE